MVYNTFATVFILSVPASLCLKNIHFKQEEEAAAAAEGHTSFCAEAGWNHEWGDEFLEDTLGSEWAPITSANASGDHSAPVSGLGVTACRTARCRPENVRLENGQLILRSERDATDPTKYFTGAVTTRGLKNWKDDQPYRMCISAKLPGAHGASRGIWPAHWMLPDNGLSEKCLDEGEVDIMEMINGDGGAYSTYHYLTSFPNITCGDFNKYHQSRNTLTRVPNWNADFHEYGIERSKDHINYAIDGKIVHHLPVSQIKTPLSHSPFFLILNTAVGGSWPGEPTPTTKLPAEHVIDYVRVSRRSAIGDQSIQLGPVGVSAAEIKSTGGSEALAKSSSWADAWHPSSFLEVGQAILDERPAGPPPISRQ